LDKRNKARLPAILFLFVLAINELSLKLQEALDNAELTGVSLGPGCPAIKSILLVDDLIIFGKSDAPEIHIISNILQDFCALSGQTRNWKKSSILFSKMVNQATRRHIKDNFSSG
jgi:hypothetical protein